MTTKNVKSVKVDPKSFNTGFSNFGKLKDLRETLKTQGFKEKESINFETNERPQLKIKTKSFKYTKEEFLKDKDLIKSIKDLTDPNKSVFFEKNGYVFEIKEKITENKNNFLLLIKGKSDTDFVDFKKFVIIGKNHKLLAGEELEQENIRRTLNYYTKKIGEINFKYIKMEELCICTAPDDNELIESAERMEKLYVELSTVIGELSKIYFEKCFTGGNKIAVYKDNKHIQRIQHQLQGFWERGIGC